MKEWDEWEIELLEFYKTQSTTVAIIAKLLSRPKEDIEQKLRDINDKK